MTYWPSYIIYLKFILGNKLFKLFCILFLFVLFVTFRLLYYDKFIDPLGWQSYSGDGRYDLGKNNTFSTSVALT